MKNYIIIICLFLLFTLDVQAQKNNYKHQLQIGRSAYYFGDQPLKIGESRIWIPSGGGVRMIAPYIAYTYRFHSRFSTSASFETWQSQSEDMEERVEVEQYMSRHFQQYILQQNMVLFRKNKITVNGKLLLTYRANTSETLLTISHNPFTWETFVDVQENDVKGLDGGVGLEIDYNFYKQFSIVLKGEYLLYSARRGYIEFGEYPKNQLGLTLSLGYNFGKMKDK